MYANKATDWLGHAVQDTIRYLVVPFLASIMPRRLSARWLTMASGWRWILPKREQARAALEQCFGDRSIGLERIALTLLNESTTAWKLLIGRRLKIRQHGTWPECSNIVAVGGHFGSGLSVLWSMQQAGLRPAFVLHRPHRAWRRTRPVYYYWSLVRFKLIERLCDGNLIVTGGARQQLMNALTDRKVTPVILFDTPSATADTGWTLSIGNMSISLPRGGRDVVVESGSDVVLFLPFTNVEKSDAELYIEVLDRNAGLEVEFVKRFGGALNRSPDEWHFWPIIQPYLRR